MRQRFFTSTAQTRLIKNILNNTPIPIYDTVQPGDYIIKGCKYIYNISLIRCIKSGLLEGDGEFLTLDYSFYWGAPKLNHTETLKDATGFYDSKVHEWLGRYLRAYRDMMGVNLMPFYNCFSGVYTSRFKLVPVSYVNTYINENQDTTTVKANKIAVYESEQSYDTYSQGTDEFNSKYVEQSSYKVLQIPVKLNRTYTIAIDCDSTVRIAPAFINHGHLVKVKIGTSEIPLTDIIIDNVNEEGIISPISIEKTNTVFIEPFTISINNKNQSVINTTITEDNIGITYEQLLQRYEKYLYLLIQLPKDNTSSVVVLEGDYTNLDTNKIFSLETVEIHNDNIPNEPEICEASVEYSSNNEFTNISNAPYMAYLNVEGLRFDEDHLKSLILSIEPDNYYGYQEYNARIIGVEQYVKVDSSEEYGVILTQPGDVNLDGEINIKDKALIDDYILGRATLNAQQIFNADINEDGVIDSLDRKLIGYIYSGRMPAPDPVYIKKNGISNLQIFSYIPIPEGTKFTVTWINPIYDDNGSYIYPTESVLTNNKLLDELLLSKLSLLQFNDEKNYPFADTLIEYLTLNVIDSAETISDNIKRTQDYFGGLNRMDSTYGAWSNYLRAKIYLDTIYNKQITHLDNIGYVDKIVESTMIEQKSEDNLPISTSYEYDNYVALKQQELRKNSRKMSTINQPIITSKNNVVNNSLLVNPSSLTPVQKLIGDNIPYKKPRDEEGMVPPGVNDD